MAWFRQLTHSHSAALADFFSIAASRTPPWLASGWGCRGRHLSGALLLKGRRSKQVFLPALPTLFQLCPIPKKQHRQLRVPNLRVGDIDETVARRLQ